MSLGLLPAIASAQDTPSSCISPDTAPSSHGQSFAARDDSPVASRTSSTRRSSIAEPIVDLGPPGQIDDGGAAKKIATASGHEVRPVQRGPLPLLPISRDMAALRARRFDLNFNQTRFFDDVDKQMSAWHAQPALHAAAAGSQSQRAPMSYADAHRVAIAERVQSPHLSAAFTAALQRRSESPDLDRCSGRRRPSPFREGLCLAVAASYGPSLQSPGTRAADKQAPAARRGRSDRSQKQQARAPRKPKGVHPLLPYDDRDVSPYAQRLKAVVRFC